VSRKKVVKNLVYFCAANLGEGPKIFGDICKSTPLPTYWPSMVKIQWLVFHTCWRNKKRNKLQRYNIMALPSAAIIRVYRLSCCVVCVPICLVVLIELRPVMGRQTDRHTHRHVAIAYTALVQRRAVKLSAWAPCWTNTNLPHTINALLLRV